MNINPETDLDLDKLFLPAWAQESPSINRYAKYEGGDEPRRGERRGREGRRPHRREAGPPIGRDRDRPPRDEAARPPRRAERRPQRAGKDRPQRRRMEREELREPAVRRGRQPQPPPLPEISVSFHPDDRGVESLARQIKMTGRAYPLFQIAQLILQKPERHAVTLSDKKQPDGRPVQPLFLCALDDTLWLSEDEAVAYILRKHFGTFYQAERTAIEPPKGKYTFVAQCGLSGVILGPPNYHDYQNQLRRLHAERFSKMPFDAFKSRVKIVRDEAVVRKWVEEQSWRTEYICLNVPEPLRLGSREAVERNFREVHLSNIVKPVESHTLSGLAARSMPCTPLRQLARYACEQQKHFPLQMATTLSQRFAAWGLQFFKVNRMVTHVSVARPHYLDLDATPVSEGIRRIVQFINANPKCTRRQLLETLAPAPAPTASAETAASPDAPAAALPEAAEPTPEQTALIADLHWLIHQGHVIEFANGVLDTAKKPAPKPPKPEVKPVEGKPQPAVEMETGAAPDTKSDAVQPMSATEAALEQSEAAVDDKPEAPAPEATQLSGVETPSTEDLPVSEPEAPGEQTAGPVQPPET